MTNLGIGDKVRELITEHGSELTLTQFAPLWAKKYPGLPLPAQGYFYSVKRQFIDSAKSGNKRAVYQPDVNKEVEINFASLYEKVEDILDRLIGFSEELGNKSLVSSLKTSRRIASSEIIKS